MSLLPSGWYTKRSNCGIFMVTPQLYYMVLPLYSSQKLP